MNYGKKITKVEVLSLNSALDVFDIMKSGQVFRVDFVTKTGRKRTIVGRSGVRKATSGAGAKYNAKSKGLMTVYEFGKGYRQVTIDNIIGVKHGGVWYSFNYLNGSEEFAPGVYPVSPSVGRTVPSETSPLYA